MILKPDTSEIMDVFNNAQSALDTLKTDLDGTKDRLQKKLEILDSQYEYSLSQLVSLADTGTIAQGKILLANVETYGSYDKYGITVHPKLVRESRNIFNFRTTTGYLFKNNISVTVNGNEDAKMAEILKHDSVSGKGFYIEQYDTDELTIVVTPDPKNTLGSMDCNMIEIQPFLPGSFNIEEINLYEKNNLNFLAQSIVGIQKVGAQRIILPKKMELGRLEIKIKLLFRNGAGKYPFGLKHLYVTDANFRDDSYIIARIDETENISYIYDNIVYKGQLGTDSSAKCSEKGIQFFTQYDGDNLSHEIELSTNDDPSYIATNTKTCYIRIPVTSGIIAVTPDIRFGRQSDE